jgi:hypothetical protein
MDAWLLWFNASFWTWLFDLVPWIQARANDTESWANQASQSATTAGLTANASMWNPSTNYALGQNAISPTNFQTYRRRVAGVSATDPVSDTTNWAAVAAVPDDSVTFAKMQNIATAVILGRSTAGTGDVEELTGAQAAALIPTRIQPISASVAASAMTLTLNPTTLDFRSATLGNGTVNTRTVSTAISLTISSGSTLGTVNGVASRIAVLAIDNAGTVELAAVNMVGGVNLDETTLISTTAEGGAGAADSATVVYSQTARSNVPFRVVGYVESTQTTAGTWAAAPSLIQGHGGQAMAAMQSLGYGQTWQNVTRNVATNYYNTTGKPILAIYTAIVFNGQEVTIAVNSVSVARVGNDNSTTSVRSILVAIIPAGAVYSLSGTFNGWVSQVELR